MSEKKKKPFYKRTWFIVIVVIIVIAAISGGEDDKNSANNNPPKQEENQSVSNNQNAEESEPVEEITYVQADAGQMIQELSDNSLKAQQTYKGQYLEVTGKINVIDSSGKYISIDGVNDSFTLIDITCYLKNDDQRDVVANSGVGETVVVKGKVKDVGEVMGYSINVDEIIAK